MNPHRSLRVRVVVNQMSMIDWEGILAGVAAFYSPIVNLTFTLTNVNLQVKYNASYPDLSPLAVVDFDWYDRFVTIPSLGSADIVLFLTPRPATPITYMGFMSSANCGPWECTVFCGSAKDHSYINGIDQGNSNQVYIAHEISHALYYMKGMTGALDNTHKHFLSGNPKEVLNELHFPPMTGSEQIADMIRRLQGALVALNVISKTRTFVPDEHAPVTVPPPPPTPIGMKLYEVAAARLGTDVSPADLAKDELGCAESVSNLIKIAYGDFPPFTGTPALAQYLHGDRAHWRELEAEIMSPGDIVMCVTGEGRDPKDHGHVGIIAKHGIMSNDSRTGKFMENYTLSSWADSFRTRGFPIRLFRRIAL